MLDTNKILTWNFKF